MQDLTGISLLIFKYLRKDLTAEEADQLQQWILQSDKNRIFFEELTQAGHLFEEAQDRDKADQEIQLGALWQRMESRGSQIQPLTFDQPLPSATKLSTRRSVWYAAAILLLLVAGGGYFLLKRPPIVEKAVAAPATQKPASNEAAPGACTATLQLANGSIIKLNECPSGVLATEDATAISKKANDQLVYTVTGHARAEHFHVLTVPKGAKPMRVTLSDGTKVLLNAASSLQYPVVFTGPGRKVSLNGEAYFEVAHNAASPFKVTKGGLEVAALGTHFNVQAYQEEETIKVTLLEGRVKLTHSAPIATGAVTDDNEEVILKPGEQAVVDSMIGININKNIDEELVMAWKNGLFYFDNTDIEEVIRELARWYDVSIDFDRSLKGSAISGQVARNSNLPEVLEYLRTAGFFNYRIQDRKITLTPYTK